VWALTPIRFDEQDADLDIRCDGQAMGIHTAHRSGTIHTLWSASHLATRAQGHEG
jgi:hypothetical protein